MSSKKKETNTVTQKDGKIITYFVDNGMWKRAYQNGDSGWGKRDFGHVKKLVPNPDIVVDVGASIGQETLYYADWAKSVYSFEPCKSTYEVLEQNVKQNNLTNVTLSRNGLSSETSTAFLRLINGNESMAFVTNERSAKTEDIEVIRFDDFPVREGKIDFVKIDVEGLEMKVLTGMSETIAKHSPAFQIELKDEWLARNGTSSEQIWDFFDKLGYVCMSSPTKKVSRENVPHNMRTKADLYFVKS
jgi:FkbM family methyltransferase